MSLLVQVKSFLSDLRCCSPTSIRIPRSYHRSSFNSGHRNTSRWTGYGHGHLPSSFLAVFSIHQGKRFVDSSRTAIASYHYQRRARRRAGMASYLHPSSARHFSQEDFDEVVNGEDGIGFLPRWYFEEIKPTKGSSEGTNVASGV